MAFPGYEVSRVGNLPAPYQGDLKREYVSPNEYSIAHIDKTIQANQSRAIEVGQHCIMQDAVRCHQ